MSESVLPPSSESDPAATEDETRIEPSRAVPWRLPAVQVVFASTLLAPLGVPLISPALPVIRDTFVITDAQASLLMSAYFVMGIVFSPLLGILIDRFGRRRVLVPSLFAFSLAGGSVAVAPDFVTILVIRLVQGTAAAGIFIATITIIGDTFNGVQRNTVLGVNSAVLFVGAAAFPVLGGTLVVISWHMPFLVYFLGLPIALLALRMLEEPPTDRESVNITYLRGAGGALATRDALVPYGTAFATEVLTFGAVLTTLPFFLTATYEVSPVGIGLIIAAVSVNAALVSSQNGRLATHFSNPQLIALGFGCYGIGLIGVWFAPSAAVVGFAVGAFGAGLGLSMPSVDAAISAFVPGQYRGGALSLRNSTTFLGRTIGPILFAGIAITTGYETLLVGAGVIALGLGIVVMLISASDSDSIGAIEDIS